MMRREDWPDRFEAFLEARRFTPFAWGSNDCATFAADWVREATDADPIAELRGKWKTEAGAARTIARLGGLREAVSARLAEIPPAQAQRGDVGLVLTEICAGAPALVVFGIDAAFGPGPRGLTMVDRAAVLTAWRVG